MTHPPHGEGRHGIVALTILLFAALATVAAIATLRDGQRSAMVDDLDEQRSVLAFEFPLRFEVDCPGVQEISGLATSVRSKGFVFAHEDSGNAKRLLVLDRKGVPICFYEVVGARNFDWEDMTIATHESRSYVVLADVGRNLARFGEITPRLWVCEEPDIANDLATRTSSRPQGEALPRLRTSSAVEWQLQYVGLEPKDYPDVESLWFDPRSGNFGMATKTTGDVADLWSIEAPKVWLADTKLEARRVGVLRLRGNKRERMITAASYEPQSNRVILATYDELWTFAAPDLTARTSEDTGAVRTIEFTRDNLPLKGQVEALTVLDPTRALIASEGKPAKFAVTQIRALGQ
ncbi:MAG: hypothetical protein H6832_10995 [Planctomycetes bacterium]|nr:hypothetical protein [Planctomycetota bacterium]MCB9891149.1 hypothetical protein [Planctomycetota bacterium]MCB9918916.1 hypothetical protein [Planctomycetota bacterium]